MLSNLFTFVKTKGSSLSLPAHGRAGARATPFLAALFAKQKTKFGGGESEGGQKFLVDVHSPTFFLFARPSEFFSKVSVWIVAEKSSDIIQETQPFCKVCVFRLARGGVYPAYSLLLCEAPRFGGRIFKQF